MAFETKALLIAIADTACRTNAEEVYNLIVKMASADGFNIKSYADAQLEQEAAKKQASLTH